MKATRVPRKDLSLTFTKNLRPPLRMASLLYTSGFVVADDRYGKMLSIFTSLVTPRNLTFSSCSPVGTLSGSLTTM